MYYSFAIVVATLCSPVFVVASYSKFNFIEHLNNTMDQCVIRNELYWKLIPWFFSELAFVDVYAISLPNAPEPINHMSSVFLQAINESKFLSLSLCNIENNELFNCKRMKIKCHQCSDSIWKITCTNVQMFVL